MSSPDPARSFFTEDFFRVYDFPFCLHTNHPDVRSSIVSLYSNFRVRGTNEVAVKTVFKTDGNGGFSWLVGDKAGASSALPIALQSLEAALCEAITRSQRRCISVHAATVYDANSVTLLVGQSGVGKSTLSLALARRGLAIATDDVALVEPETLNILPIPRCFHLDRQSIALLEADGFRFPQSWKGIAFMAPRDLDVRATSACRARTLFFVLRPRAEHPYTVNISQSEMAARLLSETGQGPLTDPETVGVLSRLAAGASCYTVVPGPLAETADTLANLILRQERNELPPERSGATLRYD